MHSSLSSISISGVISTKTLPLFSHSQITGSRHVAGARTNFSLTILLFQRSSGLIKLHLCLQHNDNLNPLTHRPIKLI